MVMALRTSVLEVTLAGPETKVVLIASRAFSDVSAEPVSSVPRLRVLHLIDSLGRGGAEHQLSLTARSLESSRVESIHTSLFQADIVGGAVGRLLNIPVIGTICSVSGEEFDSDNVRQHRLKLALEVSIWGAALRNLHVHSIAISEAVKENASMAFGLSRDRLTVIYRAIEEKRSIIDRSATRASLGLTDADVMILNAGRLVPQKGQIFLVRAMKHVLPHAPHAKLFIAGDGWLGPELQAEASRLGVADSIRLLGRRDDVPALLAASDMFAFPSLWEGLGVALIEAAGAGCACITTAAAPMTEVIQDGISGLCVPRRDPERLGQAIVELIRDPSHRARFGRTAAERVNTLCGRENVMRSIEEVYRTVHAEHRRTGNARDDV